VDGRFTCVFFAPLEIAKPLIGDPDLPQGALDVSYLKAGGSGVQETCRKALVAGHSSSTDSGVLDYLEVKYANEIFGKRLPRVKSITLSEVRSLFDLAAQQQLMGTPEEDQVDMYAIGGAIGAHYLVDIGVSKVGGSWILTVKAMDVETMTVVFRQSYESATELGLINHPVGANVAGALQKVGICGEVDEDTLQVAAGEEKPVTYTITDLAGEAAEGAIDAISSACGTFQPESGNATNGEFETTFTGETGGCTEQVTFVARTDTPIGEVTTEQDADTSTTAIAIPMFQYRYTLDYSSGSGSIHAESEGIFFVEPDLQQVIGAGEGTVRASDPAAPCLIIDTSGANIRPQQFDSDGSYRVLVSGDLSSGSVADGGRLRLLPGGFGLNLVASWSDPDCFPPGTQKNEVFAYLISAIFVTNPSLLAGLFPDGFEIPFTTDGQPTTQSFPMEEGDGSGSITLEIWQPQDDDG